MTNALESLATATRTPYWKETAGPQPECPPLQRDLRCDLAIVGGGFTGLWTALEARRRLPDARIVLVDAGLCGNAASGRNGGFCAPSISHGIGNAMQRWPSDAETLIRLGRANLDDFEADLVEYGMEVEFERAGKLTVAATPWQIEGLKAQQALSQRFGVEARFLEGDALRERLASPLYPAGLFEPNYALLNPGKMVAELRRVALARGVEIHEATPVSGVAKQADGVTLITPGGRIAAARVVLATNAAPPLLRRLRSAAIPIFDYAIVTRPLDADELASIGWTGRYGIADSGNRFHYVRKTADNRILWGGFDAVYHFGSRRDAAFLTESDSFGRLARNFARALPPLADVPLTHAWGGIIDTSARTTFFAGTAQGGRVAYAMGFTGQGVSASRFAALAMLDLLQGRETERTALRMLRRPPFPFPPEPFRWLGIRMAQHGLAREDETGRRSAFNKVLDAFGVGFEFMKGNNMAQSPRHVLDFSDASIPAVESTVSDLAVVDRPYSARSWRHFQRQGGGALAGIWEAEPHLERVACDYDELCHLLEGQVRLTDADGVSRVFGPGDSFVVAAGFSGTWENLTPVRKVFFILNPSCA